MADRLSILFQNVTEPPQAAYGQPHIAGWSESHWSTGDLASGAPKITALLTARRAMLPSSASIIGYRIASYDFQNGRLKPLGAQTTKRILQGNTWKTDVPGMALMLGATTSGASNGSRFAVRSIPDFVVVGGEYSPSQSFTLVLNAYMNTLATGGWGFLGRNLNAAQGPILKIVNGEIFFTPGSMPAMVAGDYWRFVRVRDDNGDPVSGVGKIGIPDFANGKVTMQGLSVNVHVTATNGYLRFDQVAVFPYAEVTLSRVVTRKVGRPFENYRGRRSRTR